MTRSGLTDAEYEEQRQRIRDLMAEWKQRLRLLEWDTPMSYGDGIVIVDGEDNTTAAAACKASWQYQRASLSFNLRSLQNYSDSELTEVVVHELFHAVVNEMRAEGIDHEERVVTHLTNIALSLAGVHREAWGDIPQPAGLGDGAVREEG